MCVRVRVRACMRACSLLLYGWGIVDRGVGKKGKSYGLIEIDETETGHLFVVGSLDKHIQNKKELVRLRRELPDEPGARNFACGANYLAPGWFKICLRRKLPAPGTKGGLFCICVESRNLT